MDDALATRPPSLKLTNREQYLPSIPRRRIVACNEWEDLRLKAEELEVGGSLQVYPQISASKYLNVRISGSAVVFTATHFIGHIPLNDHLALEVAPRFDVSNLIRVLRIARHSPIPLEQFVRSYAVNHEHLPSIFDEVIAAFLRSVEIVVRTGLLTNYGLRTDNTSYPKGRILVGSTIQRHHSRGKRLHAVSAWAERTVDNAPNRLLKYTMWLVDRRLAGATPRKGVVKLRTMLNQYYGVFRDVPFDRSRQFLHAPDVVDPKRLPSIRGYYVQAIQLATLLVLENSLDLGKQGRGAQAPSMLVNLQDAFETYLRNSLSDALTTRGSSLKVLDGNLAPPVGAKKMLFVENSLRGATPDIVLKLGEGKDGSLAIIEIKYKSRPSRDDLNQAIAYGASYGCPLVIIAHAREKGERAHLQIEGSIATMKVYRYAYDLAGDLEVEERMFADQMEGLCIKASSD